jgi:hypothetical protein
MGIEIEKLPGGCHASLWELFSIGKSDDGISYYQNKILSQYKDK